MVKLLGKLVKSKETKKETTTTTTNKENNDENAEIDAINLCERNDDENNKMNNDFNDDNDNDDDDDDLSSCEEPPIYFDLYQRFKRLTWKFEDKSQETVFFSRVELFSNTIVLIVCIFLTCFISTAQIIVGITNINECRLQPFIPIWLVVSGIINIIFSSLRILYSIVYCVVK